MTLILGFLLSVEIAFTIEPVAIFPLDNLDAVDLVSLSHFRTILNSTKFPAPVLGQVSTMGVCLPRCKQAAKQALHKVISQPKITIGMEEQI